MARRSRSALLIQFGLLLSLHHLHLVITAHHSSKSLEPVACNYAGDDETCEEACDTFSNDWTPFQEGCCLEDETNDEYVCTCCRENSAIRYCSCYGGCKEIIIDDPTEATNCVVVRNTRSTNRTSKYLQAGICVTSDEVACD